MINKEFEAYKIKRELKRSGIDYEFKRSGVNDFGESVGAPYRDWEKIGRAHV